MEKKTKIKILLLELAFVILVLAFDQITKLIIYHPIEKSGNDILLIKGVLRFTSVENYGASFGIFQDKTVLLTIFSSISLIGFGVFGVISAKEQNKWYRTGLVLVIAGGLGNVLDRIIFGFVRDFVYFELIDFAVFNFADSALTIGTICLIIYLLFYYDKKVEKDLAEKASLTEKTTDETQTKNDNLEEPKEENEQINIKVQETKNK